MPYKPQTVDEVYDSLEESLTNRIKKLTNFTRRSFNYVWTRAFAREVRRVEVRALSSELSGLIEYVGGPVSQTDLDQLGVGDQVSADEVNQYMKDEYLDEYVKIVGLKRFEGSRATGEVTIQTQPELTPIPAGTTVTTAVDPSGDTIDFETTERVEVANGAVEIQGVPVQALDVGQDFNVSEQTITRFEEPPVGVKGVENPEPMKGGEDRETNAELRARAQEAVRTASQGGTADGIRGYLRQNIEGVGEGDVIIDEFTEPCPPYVDVIVDSGEGSDAAVKDAIEFSRPTGVRHNLIRPQIVEVGMNIQLDGTTVNTDDVTNAVTEFFNTLGISEDVFRDRLTNIILMTSDDINNIDRYGGYIERVENETFEYLDVRDEYPLDYTFEETNGTITVTDEAGNEYIKGTDYTVDDKTADGWPETITWVGETPDNEEQFAVTYDVTVPGQTPIDQYYTLPLVRDEMFVWNQDYDEQIEHIDTQNIYQLQYVPFEDNLSITDASGDTYTKGTDFALVNNTGEYKQSIDWSIGGSRPDNNEQFTVSYSQKVYDPTYDIYATPPGEITDESGNTYTEGQEYDIVSFTTGAGSDVIEWSTRPSSIADDDEFYFTYTNAGDRFFDKREKVRAGEINTTLN